MISPFLFVGSVGGCFLIWISLDLWWYFFLNFASFNF